MRLTQPCQERKLAPRKFASLKRSRRLCRQNSWSHQQQVRYTAEVHTSTPLIFLRSYLDYLLYCFQGMSDDLATLHYRTKGRQKAPLIIKKDMIEVMQSGSVIYDLAASQGGNSELTKVSGFSPTSRSVQVQNQAPSTTLCA